MPSNRVRYRNLVAINYIVGLIGVFLLSALFAVYISNYYYTTRTREIERMNVVTASAASRVQGLLDNLFITLELLEEWIQTNPGKDPRFDAEFNRLVEIYRAHTRYRIDLRMLTSAGGLYYLPSVNASPLTDISDREYFTAQKTLAEGNVYFASPVRSRVTGKWGIPVTYKLKPNTHHILVLFAAIEFDVFDELFQDIMIKGDNSFTIVREDGRVLARSPFDEYIVGNTLNFGGTDTGYKIVDVFNPEKNTRVLFSHMLDNIPVGVVVGKSYDKVRSGILIDMTQRIVLGILVVLSYFILIVRSSKLIEKNNLIKDQLEKAARFDSLTGMRNRSFFLERATDEIERARRYNSKLVMLMLDIDKFKQVNDTWGHQAGDSVLCKMSKTIEKQIRNTDISGRIGGEEFAILLPDTGISAGLEVAERIRQQACRINLETWTGGFSIGAVEWRGGSESIEHLIKRADDYLYRAKEKGRNRVES